MAIFLLCLQKRTTRRPPYLNSVSMCHHSVINGGRMHFSAYDFGSRFACVPTTTHNSRLLAPIELSLYHLSKALHSPHLTQLSIKLLLPRITALTALA